MRLEPPGIVTTQHYMICCTTDCNDIMTEIESKIAQPTAKAQIGVSFSDCGFRV